MKKLLKNKKGFTLVELVVVIAILAILALILVPSISGYVSNAEKAKNEANARSIYTAYILAKQTNPDTLAAEVEKMTGFASTAYTVSETAGVVTITFEGATYTAKQ